LKDIDCCDADQGLRNAIEKLLNEQDYQPSLFDKLTMLAEETMTNELFRPFFNSEMYQEYLAEVRTPSPNTPRLVKPV
jgi:hypothetical protein